MDQVFKKMTLYSWHKIQQEAHGPHRSPEQQFLVTLHFVAYAFSILNIEPLSETQLWSEVYGWLKQHK